MVWALQMDLLTCSLVVNWSVQESSCGRCWLHCRGTGWHSEFTWLRRITAHSIW